MGADFWSTLAIERLGLPSIRVSDGPHGLRKQPIEGDENIGINASIPATCFPPASLASCSFDRGLFREMGAAIAEEAIVQGVDVVLGPAVNIKRSPLCGRNFEYVSEDPFLAAEYAVAFIGGVQGKGVGTSLKHFAANNQESLRFNSDSVVDERALREIYLYAFEEAVRRAGPWTIMASYNRINGDYGCENARTLTEMLRREWGFGGLVMSDWAAINARVKSLAAGCDLEMPASGSERTAEIVAAVEGGRLDPACLDSAVRDILRLVERCRESPKGAPADPAAMYDSHHGLAARIARESMVLLRNEGGILPLKPQGRYALIGAFAESPRYQGGGSSHITPTRLSSMRDAFEAAGLDFSYSPGYDPSREKPDHALIADAASAAARADAAILLVGLTDSEEYEGLDRKGLSLPASHLALIEVVAAANPRLVVVLCAGSAVETGWATSCRALLYAGVMGQAGGEAAFDLLFGKASPCGRLSETFPVRLEDSPSFGNFPGGSNSTRYEESIFVGYRYHSTAKVAPAWPFGFGLSYTGFAFSGFAASLPSISEGGKITLRLEARNTGAMAGACVAQVYVRNNCHNTYCPERELKAFEKVWLRPGESRELAMELPYRAFERYDPDEGWVADPGDYEVLLADNAADPGVGIHVAVEGRGKKRADAGLASYASPGPSGKRFNDADFELLYGSPLPPRDAAYRPITLNTPLKFCRRTLVGKVLLLVGFISIMRSNKGPGSAATRRALRAGMGEAPVRNAVTMNAGTCIGTGEGLVAMMNGRFFRGIAQVLRSMKKQ
jgi:beta-glucosidase